MKTDSEMSEVGPEVREFREGNRILTRFRFVSGNRKSRWYDSKEEVDPYGVALVLKADEDGVLRALSEVEDRKTIILTPFVELPDGRLCEQAFDGGKVYYLVYDPAADSVERKAEVSTDDCVFKPIDNDEVRERLVLLPSDVKDYGGDGELVKEVRDFLNYWHEPPRCD